eukprot:CAMPEP_0172558626 /NCGR_PEP_ID=MMETSP1067-20121228/80013_1 /TAXON_ID=265564 ORGANISM="Thalassiosira punctigera, Strain Tpunct2005C2" /NCGR_SAMPLE_ID=MMETSP1067 /ASSEMBLY_ACC=CAM_ASM_000444 /LENGTH=643 /DNA_ID=CAMNT_0013348025 /DNA_START=266 /DNA_END=2197 /DNA_ORIENTATION=+
MYDTLQVRPNATLTEIQQSWRRLSREWHPDKVALRRRRRSTNEGRKSGESNTSSVENGCSPVSDYQWQKYSENSESSAELSSEAYPPPPPPIHDADAKRMIPPPLPQLRPPSLECDNQNMNIGYAHNDGGNNPPPTKNDENLQSLSVEQSDDDEEYARQKLDEIRGAYEILSDDHTRLLYHRYGLVGGTEAATQLLSGGVGEGNVADRLGPTPAVTEEQGRLLELMGYPPGGYSIHPPHPSSWSLPHHHSYHRHNRSHSSHHHASPQHSHTTSSFLSAHRQHDRRLAYLAATVTERLRPLVEGTVSQELFVDDVQRECNALKRSPLGARILRCVGRAYRIEGYRVLRTMHDERAGWSREGRRQRSGGGRSPQEVRDRVLDGWRDAKHYASAALASGKLVLMEQRLKKLEDDRTRQKRRREEERRRRADQENTKKIQSQAGRISGGNGDEEEVTETLFASNIGELPGDDDNCGNNSDDDHIIENIGGFSDDEDDCNEFLHLFHYDDDKHEELEEELQHIQHQKMYSALLSAIQMEALWKITKIELDRAIHEACRRILEPTTIMLGNHHHRPRPPSGRHRKRHQQYSNRHAHRHFRQRPQPPDGWVGTTGNVVPMEVGRLRAAAAMVLVGDIMIQCSKEGTGWNK